MIDAIPAVAVWITVVVVGFGAAAKAGHWIVGFARRMKARFALFDTVMSLAAYQFQNNGGGSLLDLVEQTAAVAARTEANHQAMATVVDGISDGVDEVKATQALFAERFESHITLQAEASMASSRAVEAAVQAMPPEG